MSAVFIDSVPWVQAIIHRGAVAELSSAETTTPATNATIAIAGIHPSVVISRRKIFLKSAMSANYEIDLGAVITTPIRW
jgi:hypothetical protein